MNKNILILAVALILPFSTFANSETNKYTDKYQQRLQQLTEELSLTAEQQSQIAIVFKEQHEKFRTIHEESNDRIKQILTPGQMSRWEGMQKQRHEKHIKNVDTGQMQAPQ